MFSHQLSKRWERDFEEASLLVQVLTITAALGVGLVFWLADAGRGVCIAIRERKEGNPRKGGVEGLEDEPRHLLFITDEDLSDSERSRKG